MKAYSYNRNKEYFVISNNTHYGLHKLVRSAHLIIIEADRVATVWTHESTPHEA